MTSAPPPRGAGWAASGAGDSWGPSTPTRTGRPAPSPRPGRPTPSTTPGSQWDQPGPSRGQNRADRQTERSVEALRRRENEPGLPWWAALLLLIAIAAVGGIIDTLGSFQVKGGFNIGIVVASVLAILVVRRSHMFPIVIAPPIVYTGAAVFQLYLRSGGLHDRRVIFDAAANYLVYGFPAIAAATAGVLIVAGVRLLARR